VVGATSSESLLVNFFITRFRDHGVLSPPNFCAFSTDLAGHQRYRATLLYVQLLSDSPEKKQIPKPF